MARRGVLCSAVAALAAAATGAAGCSNLLVGRSASGTGSPQIAYTSDAGFQYGAMGHYPAGDHAPGTMRDVYNEGVCAAAVCVCVGPCPSLLAKVTGLLHTTS